MSCLNECELKTVEEMKKYGGSFVKASSKSFEDSSQEFIEALAECFYHADNYNKRLLIKTFPVYWNEYSLKEYSEDTQWDDNLAEQASQDLIEDSFTGDAVLQKL